jgi:cation diffusion facilitator family transporter
MTADPMARSRSVTFLTVVVAFTSNLVVAVAKTIAALITGSPSMVAESAHSWADTGNEVFLMVAERRSERAADESHPQGYGRDAYIWSMFAAFGLFSVGSALSIWHGITALTHPEASGDFSVGYIVLGISALFEGTSLSQSVRQARRTAKERDRPAWWFISRGSNPTLRAVFAEDASALVGLAIAFLGLLLHQLTGDSAYDAVGSILVGVLLGFIAVFLMDRNRLFLLGQAVDAETREAALVELLASPDIERVTYLHLEFVGPSKVWLVAAVDLTGDDPESTLAARLHRLESGIEEVEFVQEAILTLSQPADPALIPDTHGS